MDRAGDVYLVSRWTGRILLVTPQGEVVDVVATGGKPQAVAFAASGELLLADARNHALQTISSDGTLRLVANEVYGHPFLGPNDLVVADHGCVYMTDPGLDLEAPGRVLRIDTHTGHATELAHGLHFPNGITMTADGRHLMVAESVRHRILRFELRDAGTLLGPAVVFCAFASDYPDGIAFDADGNLLVTLHGGGTLEVVSPEGNVIASIKTGGKGCTNCVFGGEDFQTLYLTEDDQQALLSARWPVPGQTRFSRSLTRTDVI